MKFINKKLNQAEGNELVDHFLIDSWNHVTNGYSNIGYGTRRFKKRIRIPLVSLLLREQNNYCCYCMRRIDANDTTLEHIVPQSTTTLAELNQYIHYQLIKDYICLQSVFDTATIPLTTPPYPLEVAYENLAASCDGVFPITSTQQTCNHKRGSAFVEPLFYIPTIESEVEYLEVGLMDAGIHTVSINHLDLNALSLKHIRQVWYHISNENISDIENADTISKRNEILTLNLMRLPSDKRQELIDKFKIEIYWKTLLQYKWFYDYYKLKKR